MQKNPKHQEGYEINRNTLHVPEVEVVRLLQIYNMYISWGLR